MTFYYDFVDFVTPKKCLGLQNFVGIFQNLLDFWSSSSEKNIKQLPSLKKCSFSSCSSNLIYGHSEFLILSRAGLRIGASKLSGGHLEKDQVKFLSNLKILFSSAYCRIKRMNIFPPFPTSLPYQQYHLCMDWKGGTTSTIEGKHLIVDQPILFVLPSCLSINAYLQTSFCCMIVLCLIL